MIFDQIVNKFLTEARKSEGVSYTGFQKGGKKLTEQIEMMDKVVAKIDSKKSGQITKVIKEFGAMKNQMEAIQEKMDAIKEKVKIEIDQEFFDASDMVLTRVIETASMTLQFAKVTPAKRELKIAGGEAVELVFAEIMKLIENTDLAAQVTALKNTLYEVKETASIWRMPTIKEGVAKDAISKMLTYLSGVFSKLFKSVTSWSGKFDKKCESTKTAIENKLEALKAKQAK